MEVGFLSNENGSGMYHGEVERPLSAVVPFRSQRNFTGTISESPWCFGLWTPEGPTKKIGGKDIKRGTW